jgi:undecaprenyl-diphosphatase
LNRVHCYPLIGAALDNIGTCKPVRRDAPRRRESDVTDSPRPTRHPQGPDLARSWLAEARRLDEAIYETIAITPTPSLDRVMRMLSTAANYSRLWMGTAAAIAVLGGRPGREAAAQGLISVSVTSAVVNIALKRVGQRRRPERAADHPVQRNVRMPTSHSFPSGHAASAFAFATGVGHRLPVVAAPVHIAAGLVAYSRVHTGVHYPGDVLAGSVLGTAIAQVTTRAVARSVSKYRRGREPR